MFIEAILLDQNNGSEATKCLFFTGNVDSVTLRNKLYMYHFMSEQFLTPNALILILIIMRISSDKQGIPIVSGVVCL